MPFLNDIIVKPLPKAHWWYKQTWELFVPLKYRAKDGTLYEIPEGFVHDFASVPRILHPILSPTGPYGRAAILHDFTHDDYLFYEAMRSDGVPKYLAKLMFASVNNYDHPILEDEPDTEDESWTG